MKGGDPGNKMPLVKLQQAPDGKRHVTTMHQGFVQPREENQISASRETLGYSSIIQYLPLQYR